LSQLLARNRTDYFFLPVKVLHILVLEKFEYGSTSNNILGLISEGGMNSGEN